MIIKAKKNAGLCRSSIIQPNLFLKLEMIATAYAQKSTVNNPLEN